MFLRILAATLAGLAALSWALSEAVAGQARPDPYAIVQTAVEGVYSLGKEANGTYGVGQSFTISAASRLHSISVYISNPRYVSNMEALGLRPGNDTDRLVVELMDSFLVQGTPPRVLARSELPGFGAGADWRTFTFPDQPLLQPGSYLFGVSVSTGGLFGYHLTSRQDAYPQGRAYQSIIQPTGARFPWGPTLVGDSAFAIGLTRGPEQLRDSTPPVVVPTLSPPANESGWNNSDVTVTWSTLDPESGIVLSSPDCGERVFADETPGLPLTCYGISGAGVRTTRQLSVAIDKTPPVVEVSIDPPAETDGWRYNETTVTFSAIDDLSGVATVTPPVVLAESGEALSILGVATDLAGNTASITVEGINVWLGPPAPAPSEE